MSSSPDNKSAPPGWTRSIVVGNHSISLAIALVILLVCVFLIIYLSKPNPSNSANQENDEGWTGSLQTLQYPMATELSGTIYLVGTWQNKTTDIFTSTTALSDTSKYSLLLETPNRWEFWPSPSPNGANLAFFGSEIDSLSELYVRDMQNGGIENITYAGDQYGLSKDAFEIDLHFRPKWSMTSSQILFVAQRGNEAFKQQRVYFVNISTSEIAFAEFGEVRLIDIWWINQDEILVSLIKEDHSIEMRKIHLTIKPFKAEQIASQNGQQKIVTPLN